MPATSTKPTASRSTYHHNDLQQAAVTKAIQLISERGGPDFSLRELATSLGVSHSAVYRHFADKDALLDTVTLFGFQELARYQRQAQSEVDPSPIGQLRALCTAYIKFAREQPGYFALMFHSRPTSDAIGQGRDAHNAEALDILTTTIRRAQESGDLIPGDPEHLAAYLVLAPHGLASYLAQGHLPAFIARQEPGPTSADWLADLSLQPLLAKPATPEKIAARYFPE